MFFFFKQKTAYEMRISDWSSDVCSSDLEIDAGGQVAAEEIGFGEAEVELGGLAGQGEAEPELLAAPEQVALANADVADGTVGGREAGAEGDVAGGLLLHRDLHDGSVGRAALLVIPRHGLEEAEVLDPLAGAAQLGGVEDRKSVGWGKKG